MNWLVYIFFYTIRGGSDGGGGGEGKWAGRRRVNERNVAKLGFDSVL